MLLFAWIFAWGYATAFRAPEHGAHCQMSTALGVAPLKGISSMFVIHLAATHVFFFKTAPYGQAPWRTEANGVCLVNTCDSWRRLEFSVSQLYFWQLGRCEASETRESKIGWESCVQGVPNFAGHVKAKCSAVRKRNYISTKRGLISQGVHIYRHSIFHGAVCCPLTSIFPLHFFT